LIFSQQSNTCIILIGLRDNEQGSVYVKITINLQTSYILSYFYFIYFLFNDTVSHSGHIELNDRLKGYGGKRSWPNLRYYPGMCLETDENHEKPVRMAGFRAEILTTDLPNTKQESQHLVN
jgi:hypothetical protein